MAKTRRNVLNLPAGDQTLYWYRQAIRVMLSKPITDPTSWRFQAAIHDYNRSQDPLKEDGEQLPSAQIQSSFWTQCQHGSWYFLPWHRMYLYFFEQIVTAEIVKLGGPSDWALPYWNYSTDLNSRLLPEAFRNPIVDDGSEDNGNKNYLHVDKRSPDCNAGLQFADDNDVSFTDAGMQSSFSDSFLGGFGGPQTDFSHSGEQPGSLESSPHGSMHGAIGGKDGWMGGFNTAGLDPIFWLHHANIDRLWEVWLNLPGANHVNPTSPQWLNNISFNFYDANQQVQAMHCVDVVDTTKLGYSYDDTSSPVSAPPAAVRVSLATRAKEVVMPEAMRPELAGATERSSQVHTAPVRIRVPTPAHDAARASRESTAAAAVTGGAPGPVTKARVILKIENITARGHAGSYDVYVNIPDDETPAQHPELRAGRLDLFGVAEASQSSGQHPGSGLTYTLDITDIYNALAAQANWDPAKLDVHLVPVRKWEGAIVTIGRVSLFFG